MNNKVICVIIDGLRYRTALDHCGYMEGLVVGNRARRWRMKAALPTMSVPCYETIHTGLDPVDHGITANDLLRPSEAENVFSVARQHGRRTAAVADHMFSVLYNGAPFVPVRDMETDEPDRMVQNGRFYTFHGANDFHLAIPSDHDLCAKTDILIERFQPDYLLLHTLSCDSTGHVHGGDSWQYRQAATAVDVQLTRHLPGWRAAGYRVLVTADHGFTDCGNHGGTEDCVRDVAFYDVGHPVPGVAEETVSQRAVAPTILALMGLPVPAAMSEPALVETLAAA